MRIAIIVFPGVEEMDFVGPLEVLSAARALGAPFEVGLYSTPHQPVIRAHHGLVIDEVRALEGDFDLIVIPGGGWIAAQDSGVRKAIAEGCISAFLHEQKGRGAVIASVCTGAMLLAAAGLLDHRTATTHHSALADLEKFGVTLSTARVVDAGDIVTAGGVTSGLDLSLWLVERFAGPDLARATEDYLEYRRLGEVQKA